MMTEDRGLNRRGFLKMTTGAMLGMAGAEPVASSAAPAAQEGREVIQGIRTRRAIPGEPYDLAGKRLVFTNWHYVRPGDLDWVNDQGKSVYVHGNEGPWGAHYRGIDTPRGIRLAAQRPQRIGPLSRPSRILQEGPIIRGWAGGGYFESVDGLQWERKADLINAPDFSNVFVDPSAPEAERYKCVWVDDAIGAAEFEAYRKRRPDDWEPRALLHLAETGRVAGIRGAVSPDGIRWTKLPEPLVIEYSDTEIVAYYDAWRGKYVLYTRYWSVGPYTRRLPADIRHSWTGVGRRAIGRSETDDFRRFPPSRMIVEPTPDMAPSDVLYTNCRTSIPGAPDHHLMFPTIWHVDEDTTSVTMLSSHDGEVWHFVPGAPLMQQGASALMQRGAPALMQRGAPALMQRGAPALMETQPFGQWDGGCVWVSPPLLELPDGRFALPYRGDNFPHKYPRGQRKSEEGYAIWPRGRLVALEAPDRGEFATVAIMPPGRKLRINALTQRVGSILVQVDGAPGRSFAEATPIVGDQYRTPVTWKGQEDLGHKEGSPIILRFRMEKAKLFGLEFE